jgi:hypothetical protein
VGGRGWKRGGQRIDERRRMKRNKKTGDMKEGKGVEKRGGGGRKKVEKNWWNLWKKAQVEMAGIGNIQRKRDRRECKRNLVIKNILKS